MPKSKHLPLITNTKNNILEYIIANLPPERVSEIFLSGDDNNEFRLILALDCLSLRFLKLINTPFNLTLQEIFSRTSFTPAQKARFLEEYLNQDDDGPFKQQIYYARIVSLLKLISHKDGYFIAEPSQVVNHALAKVIPKLISGLHTLGNVHNQMHDSIVALYLSIIDAAPALAQYAFDEEFYEQTNIIEDSIKDIFDTLEDYENHLLVLLKVKLDGMELEFACEELQCDREIVLAAVKQNGMALAYASDELKNDREIVLAAVAQDSDAIELANSKLMNDEEILKEAVIKNPAAIKCASYELKKDLNFLIEICRKNTNTIPYITNFIARILEPFMHTFFKELKSFIEKGSSLDELSNDEIISETVSLMPIKYLCDIIEWIGKCNWQKFQSSVDTFSLALLQNRQRYEEYAEVYRGAAWGAFFESMQLPVDDDLASEIKYVIRAYFLVNEIHESLLCSLRYSISLSHSLVMLWQEQFIDFLMRVSNLNNIVDYRSLFDSVICSQRQSYFLQENITFFNKNYNAQKSLADFCNFLQKHRIKLLSGDNNILEWIVDVFFNFIETYKEPSKQSYKIVLEFHNKIITYHDESLNVDESEDHPKLHCHN